MVVEYVAQLGAQWGSGSGTLDDSIQAGQSMLVVVGVAHILLLTRLDFSNH